MESNHATVVAYYYDKKRDELFYLTGTESSYGPGQKYPSDILTNNQKKDFVKGLINKNEDKNVHYVKRHKMYTVQTINPRSLRGFPKGGKKSIDADTRATAIREFKEEIGYEIDNDDLIYIGPVQLEGTITDVYVFRLYGKQMMEEIRRAFYNWGRRSELFDIEFESENFIESHKRSFNDLSWAVFNFIKERRGVLTLNPLHAQGGGKNQHTRKQRRNRKSKAKTRVKG